MRDHLRIILPERGPRTAEPAVRLLPARLGWYGGIEAMAQSNTINGKIQSQAPFVKLDLGLARVPLLEGVFTDGWLVSPGVLSQAHGGVLYINDPGPLSRAVWNTVLGAVGRGWVQPVGAPEGVRVPARFRLVVEEDRGTILAGGKVADLRTTCDVARTLEEVQEWGND